MDDAQHSISTLQKYYKISIDGSGNNCCGLTFEWYYDDEYVKVYIPSYVQEALEKHQHP